MFLSVFLVFLFFFFFNDTATTEIYTLSLHDALPIWTPPAPSSASRGCERRRGAPRRRVARAYRPHAVRRVRRLREGSPRRFQTGRGRCRRIRRPGCGRARPPAARVRRLPGGRDQRLGRIRQATGTEPRVT